MSNSLTDQEYTSFSNELELDEEDRLLIEKARKASHSSYSPYSNFQVGAAALLDNNEVLEGSNQENSSYPAGLCAERVVLFFAGANYQNQLIKKLAVTAKRKEKEEFVPVTPCGSCRQVLLEYEIRQDAPIEVIMQISEHQWIKTHSSKVLLPFCFNKHSL